MNRKLNLFFILAVALLFTAACTGQESGENGSALVPETVNHNYVALTKQVPQLKALVLAATEMKADDGESFGDFHVIFCGRNVEQLTDKELMAPYVEMLHNSGAKLFACGFSLSQFNIDENDLADGIEVVENGIAYSLKMKKEGAYSIDQLINFVI